MSFDAVTDELSAIYESGMYPLLVVTRPWSQHNPVISGELARPAALTSYLHRELARLAEMGATFAVQASRPRLAIDDPELFARSDETNWDLSQKKLFLFPPERMELSLERLSHYTGTAAETFQRYVLFTNYQFHVDAFIERFPDCVRPDRPGVQMGAYHHTAEGNAGVSLVNIGVGPSNAKTISDHVAVLRPDAMLMIGHCGGLRNHQEIGDFVLATAYLRADDVLDDVLPTHIPVTSNHRLNVLLIEALERRQLAYRVGTVFTTGNRNWEFNQRSALTDMETARAVAVDMESATIAANGFRYRIPTASLLAVSDKPLHGKPKLSGPAAEFYARSKQQHLDVALEAIDVVRTAFADGIPNGDIRSSSEPVIGGPT